MAPLIRATVCTGNPHKLEEFRALFPDWELELLAGADFPPEDGIRDGRVTGVQMCALPISRPVVVRLYQLKSEVRLENGRASCRERV